MEGLKDRIAALEERLTQEVNTLKGLIQAAEAGLAVSVEEVDGGYEVTIGDETFTINHGTNGEDGTDGTDGADGTVITVVEVDGVYYWAINGEATEYPVTGNDGEDGEDGEDGAVVSVEWDEDCAIFTLADGTTFANWTVTYSPGHGTDTDGDGDVDNWNFTITNSTRRLQMILTKVCTEG